MPPFILRLMYPSTILWKRLVLWSQHSYKNLAKSFIMFQSRCISSRCKGFIFGSCIMCSYCSRTCIFKMHCVLKCQCYQHFPYVLIGKIQTVDVFRIICWISACEWSRIFKNIPSCVRSSHGVTVQVQLGYISSLLFTVLLSILKSELSN